MKTSRLHPQAEKIYKQIAAHSDEETAARIACKTTISPDAKPEESAAWVERVSRDLSARFSEAQIKTIMTGCYCDAQGMLYQNQAWIRGIWKESADMADFVARMNSHGAGWYLEDGWLYTIFTFCECPILQGIDRLPNKNFCQCTLGFTKAVFEHVFNCKVEPELIHSIKTGYEKCLIRIRPGKSAFMD